MNTIKEQIKEMNWDNDVVRIINERTIDGPIQFSFDRTVNSLLESMVVVIKTLEEVVDRVEVLEKKNTRKK
jgi:hypothetical protein